MVGRRSVQAYVPTYLRACVPFYPLRTYRTFLLTSLPTNRLTYLPARLPTFCRPASLPTCLPFPPTCLPNLPACVPPYPPTYVRTYAPASLRTTPPTCLPTQPTKPATRPARGARPPNPRVGWVARQALLFATCAPLLTEPMPDSRGTRAYVARGKSPKRKNPKRREEPNPSSSRGRAERAGRGPRQERPSSSPAWRAAPPKSPSGASAAPSRPPHAP